MKVSLRKEDALCRSNWSLDLNKIRFVHSHLLGILPDFKHWCVSLSLCHANVLLFIYWDFVNDLVADCTLMFIYMYINVKH